MATDENVLIRRSLIRCYLTLRSIGCPEEIQPQLMQFGIAEQEDGTVSTLLRPTEIINEESVELIAERVYQRVSLLDGSDDFVNELCGVFEELAMNAVQHSTLGTNSNVGGPPVQSGENPLAMIEFREADGRSLFSVAVTDFGGGIPKAMNANRSWTYDDERAIDLALRTGRTGTVENRGVGLPHVIEIACAHQGCLLIASSGDMKKGALAFNGAQAILRAIDGVLSNKIQGTFAYAALFTSSS